MDNGVSERLYGNYRAKVVNNKDKEQFGRVLIWIPDLMPELDSTKDGIWARPANNPLGGRNMESETNDNYYAGTSYIPAKGSWVWCFFEAGNINRPYYFGALDIENTKVLPENQVGDNYEKKWTILRSHEGRAIVVSDDENDERVEITGKKRQLTDPPTGDQQSVYEIDGNQTTILLDERAGKQKVLIRTYKGDFLHIDIDERKLQAEFQSDIEIKSHASIYISADYDINIKSLSGNIYTQADVGDINIKSGLNLNEQASARINMRAGAEIATDGSTRHDQQGMANPADKAEEALPLGGRDT